MKKLLSVFALGNANLLFVGAALALTPAEFSGKPAQFKPGTRDGAAIWQERGETHVRFTTVGKLRQYRGKICTREQIVGLKAHKLERDDSVKIGPKKHCVWFKTNTQGGIDGFNFKAPGKVVIFDIKLGRKALPPAQIWIGKKGSHPESSPFTLRR